MTTEQDRFVRDLIGKTTSLSEVTELLLDVSRIELGRLKMTKQQLDLRPFFGEITSDIERQAKAKGVTFVCSLPPDLPPGNLDRRLTRMAVENLLTNAVKYTPAGGRVDFRVAVQEGRLSCMVQDTGVGIPEKDQRNIFGKLFRASNVQAVDGNGFGLYVAKGAVEQQGGHIGFESAASQGTTFFIELPL